MQCQDSHCTVNYEPANSWCRGELGIASDHSETRSLHKAARDSCMSMDLEGFMDSFPERVFLGLAIDP